MAAAAGGLTVSEDALAFAAGVVVSAAVGMTGSEDGLAVAAGAAAAVFVADALRGLADCPVGVAASAAGALTVEDGLTVATGVVAFAAGVLTRGRSSPLRSKATRSSIQSY